MEFAVYWLVALVVFLVIEAVTLGLATIWFAGGAPLEAVKQYIENQKTSQRQKDKMG